MITVAAALALAFWFLLDLLAPPPPSHQHMPPVPEPGPGRKPPDDERPSPAPMAVFLQQFEMDGRPLPFGAIAARDAVQLRVLGAGPDVRIVFSIERDGTPAGEGPAIVSPDGYHARSFSRLTPGTYAWKARVGDAAATRDYPAPVPAFIVAATLLPVMTLDQSDHRQQSLPRGGRSEGGFHVHLSAAGARGDADVEVKPEGSDFNGAGLSTLQLVEGGVRIWLPLSPGGYVWRARPRSGSNTGAWVTFGGGPGPTVVIVPQAQPGTTQQPRQAQGPAPGAGVGAASGESDDDEGGGGRPKPRPSRVERPPTLWSLLTPEMVAIVAAATGVALAGLALLVRWRGR